MAKSRSTVEVIPSASRLIGSLRDVGYDFVHAVADLVDNSIAAKASEVAIDMRFDGPDSWVRIADNGIGMSGTTITEAMRFGTKREYGPEDLGKFGLGLKTASLSQCSRLTVASRTDADARRIEVRQWDLAHVRASDRWEIINLSVDEREDRLVEPLKNGRGTVVLWEDLDRVLRFKIPWGEFAKKGFLTLTEELDRHLAMVFHRFLSGEARRKKGLKIIVNGTTVEAWDPFARSEKRTIVAGKDQFEIAGDGGPGLVAYTAYILPPQEKFSSLKAFNHFAGPGKWNFQQGFYIYRADRMIQSGGWCHMRTSDEHTKLARVALDFMPDLDSAFELNVSRARVNLPSALRATLKPRIEHLAKQARKAYSPDGEEGPGHVDPPPVAADPPPREIPGNVRSGGSGGEVIGGEVGAGGHFGEMAQFVESVGRAIEKAAKKAGETRALSKIKRALRKQNPEIADDIGW